MIQTDYPGNPNYPLLVGGGIQGARVMFQGASNRSPVLFEGFGRLPGFGRQPEFGQEAPAAEPTSVTATAVSKTTKIAIGVGAVAALAAVAYFFLR